VRAGTARAWWTVAYLLGQPLVSDYLEDGLDQFDISIEEFENGRL
jgi:hypothetical protein